jgi:serine/threonine protein kinase
VEHQPWPVRRCEALPEVEARVSEPALKPFGHSWTLSLVDWVDSASRCSGVLIASRIVADRLLPGEGRKHELSAVEHEAKNIVAVRFRSVVDLLSPLHRVLPLTIVNGRRPEGLYFTATGGFIALQSTSRPVRYEYLRELEQRGGTRSYLALDREVATNGPGVAQLVVVNLAPPSVARNERLRSQFAARAAALLPLRHANVVRVYEYVADESCCYWVSEAVQGLPLTRLSATVENGRRALPIREFVRIVCDVLRGLEYAHAATDGAGQPRPAVHRQVSPGTILVSYDGSVKINHVVSCGSPELTTGPVAGLAERLPYLAPECCSGKGVDQRADVYAVGAMIWEAVANRPRSFGATLQESIEMRLQGSEPGLEQVCPDAPSGLVALTKRALAKEPGDRYQTALQLRQELEALMLSDALVSRADGSHQSADQSLVEFMSTHFSADYAQWVEIHRRRVVSIAALPKRVGGPPRVPAGTVGKGTVAKAPEPSFTPTRRAVVFRWQKLRVWLLASVLLGALATFGLTFWLEPESERPSASVVARRLEPPPSHGANAPPVAPPASTGANGSAASTDEREPLEPKIVAQDEIATHQPEAGRTSSDERPVRAPRVRTWRAPERGSPARSRTRFESDDADTLSALGKGVDETGLDLRTRKPLPPRDIDKESPYSP